jgi:hypothetical protein
LPAAAAAAIYMAAAERRALSSEALLELILIIVYSSRPFELAVNSLPASSGFQSCARLPPLIFAYPPRLLQGKIRAALCVWCAASERGIQQNLPAELASEGRRWRRNSFVICHMPKSGIWFDFAFMREFYFRCLLVL